MRGTVQPITLTVDRYKLGMNQKFIPNQAPAVGRHVGQYSRSPLRYPGGKSRAVQQILRFFPTKPDVLCSPFFGGGSVELAAANLGWQVHGYDKFQPLVDFWQTLLISPHELASEVERYFPLAKETFYEMQQSKRDTQLEEATRYFILNRCSFNGTTMSGGMSPGHGRFTPSSIERVRNFHSENLWVEQADFSKSISQNQNVFLYLDPPYFSTSRLYGRRGDLHEGYYHLGLRQLLRARGNWLLSYDDCPQVREMYRGFRIVKAEWTYGMGTNKRSREILIQGPAVA